MLFGHFSFQGTGHLKLHEVVKQRRGNHHVATLLQKPNVLRTRT